MYAIIMAALLQFNFATVTVTLEMDNHTDVSISINNVKVEPGKPHLFLPGEATLEIRILDGDEVKIITSHFTIEPKGNHILNIKIKVQPPVIANA